MAKKVLIRGNLEWAKPKSNHLNGTKFVEDPNGKYTVIRLEYNWFEKVLIWLRIMKDKSYKGSRFIMAVDPFKT